MKTLILFAILILVLSNQLYAQTDSASRESISLTIYNSNLGVVKDVRLFDLKSGASQIKLTDISEMIDPTTVKISSPKHPGAIKVLEQNYQYDLVSQEKLLDKYINKKIEVSDEKKNVIQGILLAADDDRLTLQTDKGLVMTRIGNGQVTVPSLPQGLITKPTLVWQLQSESVLQREPVEVLYQSSGLTWHAEYIASLADDDKSLDLSGWVSIENNSGTSYPNAHVKVVAGSLNRAQSQGRRRKVVAGFGDVATDDIVERGLFEYHLYDLGRPTTLANHEVKQISLLNASKVAIDKIYTYENGGPVAVAIKFKNEAKNNMGMPLPEGIIRVMKRDKDGSQEFVGEDQINHTPRDEEVTLKIGNAFDVVGERFTTDYQNTGEKSYKQTISFKFRNHKDEDITIDVAEYLGVGWTITESSLKYDKKEATKIVFHVPVKARSEESVIYTVLYSR